MASKDFRSIVASATNQGWTVSTTKKKHIKFVPPDPAMPMVVTGGTPSDRRGLQNLIGDLRRSGFVFR